MRDLVEIETAAFWYDGPEIESGELVTEEIPTEVFFLPAAPHLEKDGSFTNTQRLLQWHFKAVEPKEDCRSELWFYYHLGRKIREQLKDSTEPRDRPLLDLTWDYPTAGEHRGAERRGGARRDQRLGRRGQALAGYKELKADGSTALRLLDLLRRLRRRRRTRPRGASRTGSRTPTALEWALGVAGEPAAALQPRLGRPRRRSRGRSASATSGGTRASAKWTGVDTPDFDEEKPPDYVPPDDARARTRSRGDHPFIMQADGLGWLYVPQGLEDGPLPTHYEPHESPFANPLYSQRANPRRQQNEAAGEPVQPGRDEPGATSTRSSSRPTG